MKTISQAAKEYALYNEGSIHEDKAIKHFQSGADFVQRWIPVEEELPERGKYVLCKVNGYLPFIGSYSGNNTEFIAVGESSERYFITHWRPIEHEL